MNDVQKRALAEYAYQRINQLLDNEVAPRDLYDMTTWRLDNPNKLLAVVESVLSDDELLHDWPRWLPLKGDLTSLAIPAWTSGHEAFQANQYSSKFRDGIVAALSRYRYQAAQMWFFEGWLAAENQEL